jgi:hypothetical protein
MFNKLTNLFSLEPSLVTNNMEFWRIFTFPFTAGTIEGVFLFVFTFFFIGPKLDIKLRKNFYPIILLLLICLQGTIITLLFGHSNYKFAGMEGLSFFVLVLFTLINLNKKITFWGFRPIKSIILVTLLSITWMSSVAIHSTISGNEILIKSLSNLIFGIVTGFITYLQIEFLRRSSKRALNIKKYSEKTAGNEEFQDEKTAVYIPQNEAKLSNQNSFDQKYLNNENEFIFSEKILNNILDKINEHGKESLTEDEIKYLKEYSKKL